MDEPTSLVVDAPLAVEGKEQDANEPFAMRVRSCSSKNPIASMSQSISTPDRLPIIRDFVKSTGVGVQFAVMEDELFG